MAFSSSSSTSATASGESYSSLEIPNGPISAKGYGLRGLVNLGNSCYMNSILQCLSHTTQLRNVLFQNQHELEMKGDMTRALIRTLIGLWTKANNAYDPTLLKVEIALKSKRFGGSAQQDVHEFFTLFIGWIHNELRTPNDKSVIKDIFFGETKTTYLCHTCSRETSTYQLFSTISLPIPPEADNSVTLLDCIIEYLRSELVYDWRCHKCRKNHSATRWTTITLLPKVLVFCLIRFAINPENNETEKWEILVDFPDNEPMSLSSLIQNNGREYKYHLFGVSNHRGTVHSGHYTSLCRNAIYKEWYIFNDAVVRHTNLDALYKNDAYMLFYCRDC